MITPGVGTRDVVRDTEIEYRGWVPPGGQTKNNPES